MTQNKEKLIHRLTVDVAMDENMIPEEIVGKSNDEKNASEETASAALIYFWHKTQNETFNLDLWTKEMSVEEMNKMMFQMIMTIANTYERATSEDQIALAMRDFAEFFGEKTGIIPKTGKFEPDGQG